MCFWARSRRPNRPIGRQRKRASYRRSCFATIAQEGLRPLGLTDLFALIVVGQQHPACRDARLLALLLVERLNGIRALIEVVVRLAVLICPDGVSTLMARSST
jgi:hypothetical protein